MTSNEAFNRASPEKESLPDSKAAFSWSEWAGFALVLGAAVAIFHGAYRGFFVQDDFGWLGTSRFSSIGEYLEVFFRFNPARSYRPLSQETFFWVGQLWFGMSPQGFHLLSMAAHFAGVTLLYVLLRDFFPVIPSLAAALFYAVHNTHFRSLFWISAFPEPLAAAFFLLAVAAFIRFDRTEKTGHYALSLGAMTLGAMSKESILALPLVLAAYSLLFSRRRLEATLPFFALTGIYAFFRFTSSAVEAAPYPLDFGGGAWKNLLDYLTWTGAFSETFQAAKWNIDPAFSSPGLAAIVAGVAALLVRISTERKLAFFGILWFLLSLQPVLYFSGHIYSYYLAPSLAGISFLLAAAFPSRAGVRQWRVVLPAVLLSGGSLYTAYASVRRDAQWWLDRSFVAREILAQMPEVNREVPEDEIAYIFGFGDYEMGALQDDAAFYAYGYSPSRFILAGWDPATAEEIRHLHRTGDIRTYHAYYYLRGRLFNATEEFRLNPEAFLKAQEAAGVYAPEAWLLIRPQEIMIDIDTLTIRVFNLNAPAVDVLYSIDGELMPILAGWEMGEDRTLRADPDGTMRTGLYQFRAFRDSRKSSVLAWIPTYAFVHVR